MTTKAGTRRPLPVIDKLGFLIAPGREPDTFDTFLAKMRANSTKVAPLKRCLRCGQELATSAFAQTELRKLRPTCRACAAAGLRRAPDWVRAADDAPAPARALAGLPAYRKRLADEEADAEAAYYLGLVENGDNDPT